jgi:HEAT repeat protein
MSLFGPINVERLVNKKNIGGLIKALQHEDPSIRKVAAEGLGKMRDIYSKGNLGDVSAVVPLINILMMDKDLEVQKAAAAALDNLGDTRTFNLLTDEMKNKNPVSQKAAAIGLGNLGDKRAVELLIKALQHKDAEVQRVAAIGLGNLGDTRAIEQLINKIGDMNFGVRKAADNALNKFATIK